jgi:NAD-dependent SIR2 family protein deacetylase
MDIDSIILESDQFLRSVEISKSDFFTILLGAGASVNSGIKSASDCIWEWKRDIYLTKAASNTQLKLDDRSEQVRETIQRWLNNESGYPKVNSTDEYSFYIEKCYPIEDDRRKYFNKICQKKEPSIGYNLIALLHEAGLIKSVWTTNFDDLCRDAAIKTNNSIIDINLDSVDRIIRPMNNDELLLIKLHGDYKYGPLKNTNEELLKQDQTFRQRLIDYLNDKHMIVSGYSGRDQSVMDTLKESYSKRGSGRLYWCGYGDNIPKQVRELLELARKNGRAAYYIPTDGFDKLMISLTKVVCIDSQPLSAKFEHYLKGEKDNIVKTPFKIEQGILASIVKGNLFPIKLPQEAFQFESGLATGPQPWKNIKDLAKKYQIVAVPYKGYIWAFGTLSDINKCFEGHIIGTIVRAPIKGLNLWKDTAIYSLLLSSLTRALSSVPGVWSNQKDLIWKEKATTQRIFQNVLYSTHESIRLSLSTDGTRYYLSLTPDFRIKTDDSEQQISKEVKTEIGRTYFDKLRNNFFDDYVKGWRKLLFIGAEDKFLIEYPVQSASGFSFEIFRLPLFCKIFKTSITPIQLNANFPQAVLFFNGIQLPEPELEFSPKHVGMNDVASDFHPMRGLTKNSPYDSAMTGVLFDNKINLAVICPDNEGAEFSKFLKLEVVKISANKVNEDYLIDYPGFFDVYGVSLNVPEVNAENWFTCPEPIVKNTLQATAFGLRDKVINRIDQSLKNEIKKVLVIYIPNRWLPYTSFHIDNEYFDLHDYVKAYCAEQGVATQFINEDTIKSNLKCQINWWLSLSYYVKTLRTPWILQNLDKNTAFAGIGYSSRDNGEDDGNIVIGCSHIYNSQGQGLKYKLSKVEDKLYWDRQKKPHLSYNDAFRFGLSIKDSPYAANI